MYICPTQTERERSLLPTAQQQYGQLLLFCFFLKILGLNFYWARDSHRDRERERKINMVFPGILMAAGTQNLY